MQYRNFLQPWGKKKMGLRSEVITGKNQSCVEIWRIQVGISRFW